MVDRMRFELTTYGLQSHRSPNWATSPLWLFWFHWQTVYSIFVKNPITHAWATRKQQSSKHFMAGKDWFEQSLPVLETGVLPLNYFPMVGCLGLAPSLACASGFTVRPNAVSGHQPIKWMCYGQTFSTTLFYKQSVKTKKPWRNDFFGRCT